MSFQAYRQELRQQERTAESRQHGSRAATVPGALDAASHQARVELSMQILDLERQLAAVRVDLRQLQGVVDQGLAEYRPALAVKQAEADALEARVNALHAQKGSA